MNEIPSCYNPKETEDKWYRFWEENGLFSAAKNPSKEPFCIVIPPPNVTGILHMGHALNNTIQDILIRYNRMKGRESLWMPGTDHAGIATQNVVEKSLAKEGLKRQDLGREKFIERVWQWREKYGSTIIHQLKKLGASCDWPRIRFTMDEGYSQAVAETFIRLWQKGLIYRGDYIINWCPRCQTALSDEEAPRHDLEGSLYYLRYPFCDNPKEFVVVATTRPETMLGDTAVAVNPKDNRYKKFIGKSLNLPLTNRKIRIIADESVDRDFGTGAVKVTPAHDPDDYLLGKKHHLDFINVMHPDGRMNENALDFSGMDRFEAREVIIEELRVQGLLEKVAAHQLSAGHCYRCHTIIEPYLSKQWFVRMKPLAGPAIEAVKSGKIKFYPKRWKKIYLNWTENIQDWCISRQIWWGHRLPVYYCRNCISQTAEGISQKTDKSDEQKGIIVSKIKPENCPECASLDIYQDEDVLDTWFSSWLWPFATFGWPFEGQNAKAKKQNEEDLNYFYPTSVLVTAPEIIFFWVARMIMAGFEFKGKMPFKDVYIHGTVRDIEGKKMSKSLGNIIDPLDIINEYGTDALRFSLISITAQGQDVFLSKERFEQGRNTANKLWNAARFILMNLEPSLVKTDLCVFFKKGDLETADRWILSRFYSVLKELGKKLDSYRFNEAANILYAFFWHEFCDWYLEIIKPDIKKPCHQVVMYKVLEKLLRLMHPFMPFITEEIWQRLNTEGTSIMRQSWPHMQKGIIDKKLETQMEALFGVIKSIRNLRAQIELKGDQNIPVSLYAHSKGISGIIKDNSSVIQRLARTETVQILNSSTKPQNAISDVTEGVEIYLIFSGLIDTQKEREKIKVKSERLKMILSAKKGKMKNTQFLKNAPSEVVNKEKESMLELENTLERLTKIHDELC